MAKLLLVVAFCTELVQAHLQVNHPQLTAAAHCACGRTIFVPICAYNVPERLRQATVFLGLQSSLAVH